MDKTTFAHAFATKRTESVTGLVDTDRAQLIDLVRGRSASVLGNRFTERGWAELVAGTGTGDPTGHL